MSAKLHLAAEDDLDRLLPLVAAYHAFEGIAGDDDTRRAALTPLLAGSPLGAVWLIGLRRAPVGYIALSFGWSIEFGGMDGIIDEFFIRENVRGRGMGTEVLMALMPQLAQAGLKALHLEADPANEPALRLYQRRGFKVRDGYHFLTWRP
ncbi:GNAT family N-acetyltransferase [Psychromarinibacter halotolerans]|uniref:GNAT family N-acetyltransferase n=1 Tax=Psychromarinibacter halotolerans TaxID=1775175 RepID=A0ABV7GSI4_9RHOB|nr:GNAT family N-acetyltransferase [Psychromarinibacter halotolerans]MDF0595142.1 GNAT family N-acetyltransferase [Psychromarinibacter halotolerans]